MNEKLDKAKARVERAAKAAGGSVEWRSSGCDWVLGSFCFTLHRRSGLPRKFKLGVELGVDRFYGELARFSVQTFSGRLPQYKLADAEKVLRRRHQEGERRVGLRLRRSAILAPVKNNSEESRSRGHNNACAVLSLSAAAGCSFEDADAFWKLYGARKHDQDGTFTRQGLDRADANGARTGTYRLELLGVQLKHIVTADGLTVNKFLGLLQSGGHDPVFFQTYDHCSAVMDGELHDSGAARGLARIQRAYWVTKLNDA